MAVQNVMGASIYALPEDCLANALALTTPKDACRLSLVASTFHSAAQFDAVWERFLPNDYRDLISRAANRGDFMALASKKDLFFHLCDNPVIIDDGTKSFSLEKGSGKKCFMLAARSLDMVWGNDTRYWKWISLPESRFPEAAELLDVCWLEIHCKISTKMLSLDTKYAAYLVYKARSSMAGFESQPLYASVAISGEETETRTVYLDPKGAVVRPWLRIGPWRLASNEVEWRRRMNDNAAAEINGELPKQRGDDWMELELGEIFIGQEEDVVEIMLKEVDSGRWKSGIIIQGIEIRPKWDKNDH